MFKKIALLIMLIGAGYMTCWFWWRSGSIMASSNWHRMLKTSTITVKRLPSSAPLWAVPFSFLSEDSPYYRCEYYRHGSSMLFSAQTFQGGSFSAKKAAIKWDDAGAAIVYLDDDPIFKCNPEGYWTKAK